MKPFLAFAIALAICCSISSAATHEESDRLDSLRLEVATSCDGNSVTITGRGENISGANVNVKDFMTGALIASGKTDENGTFRFTACDGRVDIRAVYSDFRPNTATIDLLYCRDCELAAAGCSGDAGCPAGYACSANRTCEALACACGYPGQHSCIAYECCSDGDCPSGEACSQNTCTLAESQAAEGCASDAACLQAERCAIPPGALSGTCVMVEAGACGEVKEHAFIPYGYECGSEPGCPSCPQGSECISHACAVQSSSTQDAVQNATGQGAYGGTPKPDPGAQLAGQPSQADQGTGTAQQAIDPLTLAIGAVVIVALIAGAFLAGRGMSRRNID